MADLKVTRPELATNTGQPLVELWHDNGDGTWSATVSGGGGGGGTMATAAKGATAAGSPTSTAASADRQPLDVILRAADGSVATVGGGTQYAELATTSPATGTVSLGRYNATRKTLTDAQLSAPALDTRANQYVNLDTRLDPVNDGVTTYPFGQTPAVISTATTTTVKTGSGVVASIRVLGGTLGNVTVYDNTAGSGTVIVPTVTPTQGQILVSETNFTTGLTIVTAAATLILVTYR